MNLIPRTVYVLAIIRYINIMHLAIWFSTWMLSTTWATVKPTRQFIVALINTV